MKRLRKNIITIIIILLFLAGAFIFSFPYVSDYFHTRAQSRVIETFQDALNSVDDQHLEELIKKAKEYNEALRSNPNRFRKSKEELAQYHTMLQLDKTNIENKIIGTLEIKELDMTLPIYLGTDDETLRIGIGHIEGSSLPVGGPGSHTVITGHRGLHTAKLMTDIDRIKIGDVFTLNILNLRLHYKTDQISIVLPDDFSNLTIYPDKDYATLLTCTPIGVNTHRLLIRGTRIPDENISQKNIAKEEYQITIWDYIILSLIFLSLLMLLIAILMIIRKIINESRKEQQNAISNSRKTQCRKQYSRCIKSKKPKRRIYRG